MPSGAILMETVWICSAAMARTASTMLALGTPLPAFRLARVNGDKVNGVQVKAERSPQRTLSKSQSCSWCFVPIAPS
jgi:amino acid permease